MYPNTAQTFQDAPICPDFAQLFMYPNEENSPNFIKRGKKIANDSFNGLYLDLLAGNTRSANDEMDRNDLTCSFLEEKPFWM